MAIAPSFQDSLDVGEAELKLRRADLLVADGDITLAQLHAGASMADAQARFAAEGIKATFLDGASGDDLTALVDDRYNIQRQAATSAQVLAEFTRPSAGGSEPAGVIQDGTVIATGFDAAGNTVEFATDEDLYFGAGILGPLAVGASAVETGPEGNVAANTLVRIIDVPEFDSSFVVSNPARAGGGNVEETDPELRERSRTFFTTLRRGTLAALEYGALQVPTVRVAVASEDAQGNVTVTVTDADGNSTAQMVADVETELENWRCAGTIVTVAGGSVLTQDFDVTIDETSPGYAIPADAIAAAITARASRFRAGETLFLDSMIGAIIAVDPENIFGVTFNNPTSDVVAATGQVIRAGTVTVS